jgi:hypothetical protein
VRPHAILLSLLLLGALAAPASGKTALDAVDRATTADAARGLEAWVGDGGVLRLRVRSSGATETAPVRGGIAPYQLDVGTDASGNPVVTYARCNGKGERCDLYIFNPRTRKEVASRHNTRASEIAPSMFGGLLSFARGAQVYIGGSSGRAERVAAGPGVIGFTWTELSDRGLFVGALYSADFREQRMLRLLSGKVIRMDRATSGGASAANMTKPFVGDRHVFYARTNNGSGLGNRFFRIHLKTGKREEARGSSRVQSATWLGSRFLITEISYAPDQDTGLVSETDRIAWAPAPPPKRN